MTTIRDCWNYYEQTHLPNTASPEKTKARWAKLQWFADLDAETISLEHINQYADIRGVKPGTLNRDLTTLNAVIRHAWKAGKVGRLPFIQKMPAPPPKMRYLTQKEAERIVEAARNDTWQTLVFILIGLATGARTGAILDLTWDQVDLDEMTVDFRSTDNMTRRRKGRAAVPINDMLKEAITIARKHINGPFVIHFNGSKLSSVQRMMKRVAKTSGVEGFTAHVMRHTVASLLLQSGEELLTVSRLLGHKNSKITEEIYFKHNTRFLKKATDKLRFSRGNK